MNFVLDTNVVVYLQKGILAESLPEGLYSVSVITEMELLSYPGLLPDQEFAIHGLLDEVTVVGISYGIKREAIRLRREHRLRLPDAIIAATAIATSAELLSNDSKLAGISGLSVRAVRLRA